MTIPLKRYSRSSESASLADSNEGERDSAMATSTSTVTTTVFPFVEQIPMSAVMTTPKNLTSHHLTNMFAPSPSSADRALFKTPNGKPLRVPRLRGNQHKATWTSQEDMALLQIVQANGRAGKWNLVAKELLEQTGVVGRTAKQCRDRYLNHVDPSIKRTPWTEEEVRILADAYERYGTAWSRIAKLLPGRTDHAIKNRFYCELRKQERKEKTGKTKQSQLNNGNNKKSTRNDSWDTSSTSSSSTDASLYSSDEEDAFYDDVLTKSSSSKTTNQDRSRSRSRSEVDNDEETTKPPAKRISIETDKSNSDFEENEMVSFLGSFLNLWDGIDSEVAPQRLSTPSILNLSSSFIYARREELQQQLVPPNNPLRKCLSRILSWRIPSTASLLAFD